MFIITTDGRQNISLFLVDRTKIKSCWWTSVWYNAIQFRSRDAAEAQARKYRYKNPRVITIEQARLLSKENDRNIDYDILEHPFSSEALGQE